MSQLRMLLIRSVQATGTGPSFLRSPIYGSKPAILQILSQHVFCWFNYLSCCVHGKRHSSQPASSKAKVKARRTPYSLDALCCRIHSTASGKPLATYEGGGSAGNSYRSAPFSASSLTVAAQNESSAKRTNFSLIPAPVFTGLHEHSMQAQRHGAVHVLTDVVADHRSLLRSNIPCRTEPERESAGAKQKMAHHAGSYSQIR